MIAHRLLFLVCRVLFSGLVASCIFPNLLNAAPPPGLFPFTIAWDSPPTAVTDASVADITGWLDAPAGKHGYIRAEGSNFITTDTGQRIRFLGVNLAFAANFPEHADAEKLAARLARLGVNCVRFHHMDRTGLLRNAAGRRATIWNEDADGQTLDPAQLDRLDYLFAQLKARGIYANINLHVSRTYPGFPAGSRYHKALDMFVPGMIALQKQYARDLLHHKNNYTGLRYADDPAVAIVEINNENGVVGRWWRGNLDTLDPLYVGELNTRWNAWLTRNHGSPAAALAAWKNADATDATPTGPELLKNHRLANLAKNWTLQNTSPSPLLALEPPASPGPGIEPRGIVLRVLPDAAKNARASLLQPVSLKPGARHTLRITLEADSPAELTLDIKDARPPWRTHFSIKIPATDTLRTVENTFVYKENAPASGIRLALNLRATASPASNNFRVQEISLREGGSSAKLPAFVDAENANNSANAAASAAAPTSAHRALAYLRRDGFETFSPAACDDWLRFLWETEDDYWTDMREYLRRDLGIRSILVGSQLGAYSLLPLQQKFDALDHHAYWQHPQTQDNGRRIVQNLSMVNEPGGAYAASPAFYRAAGKPYLLTEYNHSSPNTFGAEAFPIISAYGAFQDWSGIFVYSYAHGTAPWDAGYQRGQFDIDQHPLKLATLPIAAALFLRGDTDAPAGVTTKTTTITPEEYLRQMRRVGPNVSAITAGATRTDALRHRVAFALAENKSGAGVPPATVATPSAGPITTEGGALTWDAAPNAGIFTIRSPRTKAAIGFACGRSFDLDGLVITPGQTLQDWSTIALSQLSGDRVGSPGRALLVACGYIENTGQIWHDPVAKNSVKESGRAPTLVEGIPAKITLTPASGVTAVEVWSLDEHGRRARSVPVTRDGPAATFHIGPDYRTIWYEVITQ
ncbi:hypothetical protein Ga0100230_003070 [Opitutaceae bacterium TAV3]|nr:hypothetical protein Ga0100230_003070 [Opitutaceae bacterium TAV3]